MPWCNESVRSNVKLLALFAGALLYSTVLLPASALATDTDIGVTICGAAVPAAQVSITQPINDSVVNQPNITFRGSVTNATQIEVSIDAQYTSTVSIGQGEGTFQFDTTLPVGTHTVSVKANALCDGEGASDSIVVTHTPAVEQPSTGVGTPTSLDDGQTTLDGTPVVTEEVDEDSFVRAMEQLPVIGSAINVVYDFAATIGLESTVVSGNVPAITGAARVGITVAALTSVVMASSLAPLAVQSVPGVSELFNATSHRSMVYLGWVIRGIGVLAMALAYFI